MGDPFQQGLMMKKAAKDALGGGPSSEANSRASPRPSRHLADVLAHQRLAARRRPGAPLSGTVLAAAAFQASAAIRTAAALHAL
jgi:hypothetical protein